MDDKDKILEVSPEERTAEEEATKEVRDEDLKETLAAEFGLDPDDDADTLEKLVQREKSHREKLSGAIKQKINWRTKAQSSNVDPDGKNGKGKSPVTKKEELDVDKLIDQKVTERLEERDLKGLDLPDELKTEIKGLAKLKGISVREAAQDPYIVFKKTEMEKQDRLKKAIPTRSNKGGYTVQIDPSKPLNPADFNLSTEEGRKAWKEARATRANYKK